MLTSYSDTSVKIMFATLSSTLRNPFVTLRHGEAPARVGNAEQHHPAATKITSADGEIFPVASNDRAEPASRRAKSGPFHPDKLRALFPLEAADPQLPSIFQPGTG